MASTTEVKTWDVDLSIHLTLNYSQEDDDNKTEFEKWLKGKEGLADILFQLQHTRLCLWPASTGTPIEIDVDEIREKVDTVSKHDTDPRV